VGQISNDAQTTLHRSTDGGVTWTALETFDGAVSVVAITQQGPLLDRSTYANGVFDYKFQVLGSSTVVRPPAGYKPAYSGSGSATGWQKEGGREVLKLDGSPLVTLPDLQLKNDYPIGIQAITGDTVLLSWLDGPTPQEQHGYLGVMKNGVLTKVLRGDPSLTIGSMDNENSAWGNVWASPTDVDPASSNSQGKLHPMHINLQTGEVMLLELYGPAFSDAYAGQRNRIREFESGPFLRVTGAGDCLNVREQSATSAKSLGCFADNVLLRNLAQEESSGGITWKKVETPGGQQGWASSEFLSGTLSNP
jgi:hypothetical protein